MNKIKFIFLTLVISFGFSLNVNSKPVPASFADLAEKLMPSVVNISTTTTITTNSNPFPFQFPPGSPFEDMFKEFGTPQERQSAALPLRSLYSTSILLLLPLNKTFST